MNPIRWVLTATCFSLLAQGAFSQRQSIASLDRRVDGIPVVRITLRGEHASPLDIRAIFDTGASVTILDHSIPSAYLEGSESRATLRNAAGEIQEVQKDHVRSLELGGKIWRDLLVVRADLSGVSAVDDQPVQAIVGMDLMKDHAVRLDFTNGEVIWDPPIPQAGFIATPLRLENGDRPTVELRIGDNTVRALCDTGSSFFLELSEQDCGALGVRPSPESSGLKFMLGSVKTAHGIQLAGVPLLGDHPFCALDPVRDINLGSAPGGFSLLGAEAFGPSAVFDFKKERLYLRVTGSGCLESTPQIHAPVLLRWDRHEPSHPRLLVAGVKPGSVYEAQGLQSGDWLLQVGSLRGENLTIKDVLALVMDSPAISLVVDRNGVQLTLPPRKYL